MPQEVHPDRSFPIPLPLAESLAAVYRHRGRLAGAASSVALLTLLASLLLPVYYRATTTLLPETQKSTLPSLDQFADVARLAGVSVGPGEVPRLYPEIVRSGTILVAVIERTYRSERFAEPVNLIRYFGRDTIDRAAGLADALEELRGLLETSYDAKTGIVRIALDMREPALAADVLNVIVSELDRFIRLKQVSSAGEKRKWIETRLGEVEQELRRAEERLKTFREQNRRISDSPQLLLDQERILRDIQVKSAVFIELRKQIEIARIDEIKSVTMVNVLDPARPPVEREYPRPLSNTVIAFLLAAGSGVAFVVLRTRYGRGGLPAEPAHP